MKTTVKHLPKSKVELTVETDEQDLAAAEEKVLKKAVKHVNVPGFRHGKAPAGFVRAQLKEEFVRQETLSMLANDAFRKGLEKEGLEPVGEPEIKIENEGELPRFNFNFAVWPKVELGDYKKALAELKTGKEIETAKTLAEAERKASREKKEQVRRTEKLGRQTSKEQKEELEEKILEALLQTAEVEIPEVLIESEVEERLLPARKGKVERLGLSLENYLKATKRKSMEEFKRELRQEAERIIKLRLILQKIAEQEKIPLAKDADLRYILDRLKAIVDGK